MDITEFYKTETDEVSDKTILKQFLNNMLLSEKKITMQEYEFCIAYIDNGCMLKNGKYFADISAKMRKNKLVKNIIAKHDCKKLISQLKEERGKVITFVDERLNAIELLFDTIYDHNKMLFGMYGFAGTGKTTLIMEIVQFLILHDLIKNVVFTAPTHKALNVMKSNFNKLMPNLLDKLKVFDQNVFDNNLMELRLRGLTIEFSTIHKLLGYTMDINNDGERVFAKKQGVKKLVPSSEISRYEVIIIDECSMISIQMITELFAEIRKNRTTISDYNKIPKIIFTGDPAQLPPVNEKSSSIFIKSKNELPFSEYVKFINSSPNIFVTQDTLKAEYETLITDITAMPTVTLKKIFRNSRSNVLDLCLNVRQWVVGERNNPTLGKFVGNGVVLYKNVANNKLKTEWFKKCIELFKTGDMSNIILTWTNHQSDVYNNTIRKILLKKDNVDVFEVGDVLILNDFYSFNEAKAETVNNDDSRFYTSEQIKILKLNVVEKRVAVLQDTVMQSILNLKNSQEIIKKYKSAVNKINTLTKKIYTAWQLNVTRLSDGVLDQNARKEYTMYVVHNKSSELLKYDSQTIVKIIQLLLKNYQISNPNQMATIERCIMKPLWKYWNENFVAQFASVIFGYSITTHKAQGSTFNNVFIDADDILQNTNLTEVKRCIYTSHTRCSNEIHILA